MQQEDDLRGLARVMDFMRAVSILFVGINVRMGSNFRGGGRLTCNM